jgi:hypothetical protein
VGDDDPPAAAAPKEVDPVSDGRRSADADADADDDDAPVDTPVSDGRRAAAGGATPAPLAPAPPASLVIDGRRFATTTAPRTDAMFSKFGRFAGAAAAEGAGAVPVVIGAGAGALAVASIAGASAGRVFSPRRRKSVW